MLPCGKLHNRPILHRLRDCGAACGEKTFTSLSADFIVRSDRTITVGATGCDYTTIEGAFTAVNSLVILDSAIVTMDIQAGTYSPAANAVQLLTPFAGSVIITGATPYDTGGATGIQAISGTTGAETIQFNMASTAWQANISVNDYVSVTTGGGLTDADKQAFGFSRVTNVDTTNNRLTVQSRHRLDLSAIINGGSFPATLAYTIKKPLTLISVNYSTATDIVVYMSRSPLSISNLAMVNTGRGVGNGLRLVGSGNTTISNCFIAGFGGSAATGEIYGLFVGPQQYIAQQSSIISDCRIGLYVQGGTVYVANTFITGCYIGGYSELNGLLYFAAFSLSQGNTLGASASYGGTIINGYACAVQYNTTGASVAQFARYSNQSTHAENTTDYAQTINELLSDGSFISDPE